MFLTIQNWTPIKESSSPLTRPWIQGSHASTSQSIKFINHIYTQTKSLKKHKQLKISKKVLNFSIKTFYLSRTNHQGKKLKPPWNEDVLTVYSCKDSKQQEPSCSDNTLETFPSKLWTSQDSLVAYTSSSLLPFSTTQQQKLAKNSSFFPKFQ